MNLIPIAISAILAVTPATHFASDDISIMAYEQYENIQKESVKLVSDIILSPELQQYTFELCVEYEISFRLLLSVMSLESNFEIDSFNENTNGTVDYGLMQINSTNLDWIDELAGKDLDLAVPRDNILAGVLIFDFYRRYWESKIEGEQELIRYTLSSYNMGISGFKKAGYVSRAYDRIILKNMENFKID